MAFSLLGWNYVISLRSGVPAFRRCGGGGLLWFGDGVVAAGMPGAAFGDALEREPAAAEEAVAEHGLAGVF